MDIDLAYEIDRLTGPRISYRIVYRQTPAQ